MVSTRNFNSRRLSVFTCVPKRLRASVTPLLGLVAFVLCPMSLTCEERPLEQYLRVAQAHFDQERFQAAIAELQKVIALNPSIPGTYYQLGYCHWKLGKSSEAQRYFERELQFKPPDPYSHYYLGRSSWPKEKRQKL